ncbi:hypothetical protein VCEM1676A_002457 [Vibrio cholerae O1 str. EM-1676A]|nr:hypothetical protein VCEM1676A_002457 [Vibrio cholerae O1 str. EM-1676A]
MAADVLSFTFFFLGFSATQNQQIKNPAAAGFFPINSN